VTDPAGSGCRNSDSCKKWPRLEAYPAEAARLDKTDIDAGILPVPAGSGEVGSKRPVRLKSCS